MSSSGFYFYKLAYGLDKLSPSEEKDAMYKGLYNLSQDIEALEKKLR